MPTTPSTRAFRRSLHRRSRPTSDPAPANPSSTPFVGSELDAEVEAERRERGRRRPGGDLPGQKKLFDDEEEDRDR